MKKSAEKSREDVGFSGADFSRKKGEKMASREGPKNNKAENSRKKTMSSLAKNDARNDLDFAKGRGEKSRKSVGKKKKNGEISRDEAENEMREIYEKPIAISRREENLRERINNLNYELDEKRAAAVAKIDAKFERLQRKIKKNREKQEEKITRREKSKLFAKSKILYFAAAWIFAIGRFFRGIARKISKHQDELATRRPHRSFYLTPRGKARRGIKMRGYVGFCAEVWKLIWRNKKLFTKFLVVYALLSVTILGLASQENFASLRDAINAEPNLGFFAKYWYLISGAISTGSSGATSATQTTLVALVFLYGWLTLVWLIRQIANGNGKKLKLRDGIYGGGSPVLATGVILIAIVVQLLPFALVLMAYASVTSVGWINVGVAIENMAAWCALAAVAILTLYWLCSSLISLVVVALPGMYPFRALRAAGDLVTGRRVRVILRLIFMFLPLMVGWIVVLTPAIILDNLFKSNWLPIVPIFTLLLTSATLVWSVSYIYLLYRRMVDDPAPPVAKANQLTREGKRKIREERKIARESAREEAGGVFARVKKKIQRKRVL